MKEWDAFLFLNYIENNNQSNSMLVNDYVLLHCIMLIEVKSVPVTIYKKPKRKKKQNHSNDDFIEIVFSLYVIHLRSKDSHKFNLNVQLVPFLCLCCFDFVIVVILCVS